MKDWFKKTIIFIAILILVMICFNILSRYILPNRPLFLISESMEPALHKGDIVFYTHSQNYTLQDIVVFPAQELPYPVVSRIIAINPDGTFQVKGDHNPKSFAEPYLDETHVAKEQITGKIVWKINSYVYFSIDYGIKLIISYLLTNLIYLKLKKKSKQARKK